MPQIFVDNFNSYSDGDLNGQGSWSGSTVFDVQGTTVQEGAKAVQATQGLSTASIEKIGTATPDGSLEVWMRVSGLTEDQRWIFNIREGTTLLMSVRFYWDGGVIQNIQAGPWTTITTWTANTYHKIEVEWEGTGDTHRVRVDGGTWTSFTTGAAGWTTGPNDIQLSVSSDNATSRDYFFDNIGPAATAAATNNVIFFGTNW